MPFQVWWFLLPNAGPLNFDEEFANSLTFSIEKEATKILDAAPAARNPAQPSGMKM
ncbi:hypothetical protein HFO56_34200 [Rhizobium laguerreae]|uniref:hypothetical protein n=1 Tax=Rhizobium laguerreae TaxID=1076926 RepID=UPI001C8FE576|nr:hypothetical protein [Rhizobium laguerreae]MBY3157380.1 hypothetical protein [Rhizobium laguerreae]